MDASDLIKSLPKSLARRGPSTYGMEACGSAHYWGRELKAMGHEVLLMPPAYTKPYVKRGKNPKIRDGILCGADGLG